MSTTMIASKTSSEDLAKQSHQSQLQQLKAKKETLEKALNSKYELLHMICQQEALLTLGNIDIKNLLCIQQQQSQNAQPHSSHQQSITNTADYKAKMKDPNYKAMNGQPLPPTPTQHIMPPQQQHQNRVPKIEKIYSELSVSTQPTIDYRDAHLTAERKNSIKSNSSYGLASLNSYNSNSSHGTAAPSLYKYNANASMNHDEYGVKFSQNTTTATWNESTKNFSHPNISQTMSMSRSSKHHAYEDHAMDAAVNMQAMEYLSQYSPNHHITSMQQQNLLYAHELKQHQVHSFNNDFVRPAMSFSRSSYNEDVKSRNIQRAKTISNHHSPNHHITNHTQGLGGYWTIDNNNQRVWISDSAKFPSSPMIAQISKMSKKSNSLGNFEFIQNKSGSEQFLDDGMLQQQQIVQNESRKKSSWCETSLDDVVVEKKHEFRRSQIANELNVANNNYMHEMSHDESQIFQRLSPSIAKIKQECIYLNPLANNHYVPQPSSPPPIIPPKSAHQMKHNIQPPVMHSHSQSPIHIDVENNVVPHVGALSIDSPDSNKFTVVQEGSWKPYKEEVKSYEISDFYKYSVKYQNRLQQQQQNN